MRRFSAEYLETTRAGLWEQHPEALDRLQIGSHDRIVDVGAGSGEFTAVLRRRSARHASILAVDADGRLLRSAPGERVVGDATTLPLRPDAAGLVCCQALLANLSTPLSALGEFHRVAKTLGAAVEPANEAVHIRSTVEGESRVAAELREMFLAGVETDVTIGDASALFERAGFRSVRAERVVHRTVTEPPYDSDEIEAARRKLRAAPLVDHRQTLLAGGATPTQLDQLAEEWRAVGRTAVEQMQAGDYRRVESVPYYVTVGRV